MANNERELFYLGRPPKPIEAMTDEDCEAWAEELLDALNALSDDEAPRSD